LYVPAEEIDEAGDFDTPLQPHNVWSTPRNSGDRSTILAIIKVIT
jgi:hypothetical protein